MFRYEDDNFGATEEISNMLKQRLRRVDDE